MQVIAWRIELRRLILMLMLSDTEILLVSSSVEGVGAPRLAVVTPVRELYVFFHCACEEWLSP
jgi:hypothetical protein